jgi:polyphosphate glucokinase
MEVLGIDIGGSGIKAARVDTQKGELLTKRVRIDTPSPSTPKAVAGAIGKLVERLEWTGPAGCGFPGVVRNGVILTAANVSKQWVGVKGDALLRDKVGGTVAFANDADVAGIAEMRFGAGRGRDGLVMMFTLGTGIGSALFMNGVLVPNVELGHLEMQGREAEKWASSRARKVEDLSWKAWGRRVNAFLGRMHAYFWPELIIIGGGVSRRFEKFRDELHVKCEVVPAVLENRAGVVGAAVLAAEGLAP